MLNSSHRSSRRALWTAALLATFPLAHPAFPSVTSIWDGSVGTWSDPSHWSSSPSIPLNDSPPGATYDVSLSGGSLTLDLAPSIQQLNLSGGSLLGPGTLTTNGLFAWSGGALSNVALNALAGVLYTASAGTFSGGSLLNASGQTFAFAAPGSLSLLNNATFNNQGTFTSSSIGYLSGNFRNSGLVSITNVSTVSTFDFYNAFQNSGTVSVQNSSVRFTGSTAGTASGAFFVDASSRITFSNFFTFDTTASFSGAGTLRFSSLSQTFSSPYAFPGQTVIGGSSVFFNHTATTAANVSILSGTLGGSGSLTVTGPFLWSGGNLAVSTTLQSGGTLTGSSINLTAPLTNPAGSTVVLAASSSPVLLSQFLNAGTLLVAGNATFGSSPTAGIFTNTGTVLLPSDTSVLFSSGPTFDNAGTVTIPRGSVTLSRGGTHTGLFSLGSSANLRLSGGVHSFLPTSSISGTGSLSIASGTVNLAASTLGVPLATSGGVTNLNATASSITTPITLNAGTLAITGDNSSQNLLWNPASSALYSTLAGPGTTTVPAGATFTLAGNAISGLFKLSGRSLVNNGALSLSNTQSTFLASLLLDNGTLTNNNTFTISATLANAAITRSGTSAFFNNASLLVSGTNNVSIDPAFHNAGTLSVNVPTLTLTGGGVHSGTITVAPASTLWLNASTSTSTFTFTPSARLDIQGSLRLTGGTFSLSPSNFSSLNSLSLAADIYSGAMPALFIDAPIDFPNPVSLASGTLSITGNNSFTQLSNNGPISFHKSVLTGPGTTTLSSSSVATLDDPSSIASFTLAGRTLQNAGTVSLAMNVPESSTSAGFFLANAIINNTGTFIASAPGTYSGVLSSSGASSFLNAGSFLKTGPNNFLLNAPFTDTGSIDVQAGTLSLTSTSSHSGSLNIAPGATLRFAGTNTLSPTLLTSGSGTLLVTAGITSTPASLITSFPILLKGGTLSVTGNLTPAALSWSSSANASLDSVLTGGSTVTLQGASTFNGSSTTGIATLRSTSLVNNGTLTFATAGTFRLDDASLTNTALLNLSSGTLTALSPLSLLSNFGTLTQVGLSVDIYAPIVNQGTLSIPYGNLISDTSFSAVSGPIIVAAGASLTLKGPGSQTLGPNSSLSGAGVVAKSGTLDVYGAVNLTGTLILNGATTFYTPPQQISNLYLAYGTTDFQNASVSFPKLTLSNGTLTAGSLSSASSSFYNCALIVNSASFSNRLAFGTTSWIDHTVSLTGQSFTVETGTLVPDGYGQLTLALSPYATFNQKTTWNQQTIVRGSPSTTFNNSGTITNFFNPQSLTLFNTGSIGGTSVFTNCVFTSSGSFGLNQISATEYFDGGTFTLAPSGSTSPMIDFNFTNNHFALIQGAFTPGRVTIGNHSTLTISSSAAASGGTILDDSSSLQGSGNFNAGGMTWGGGPISIAALAASGITLKTSSIFPLDGTALELLFPGRTTLGLSAASPQTIRLSNGASIVSAGSLFLNFGAIDHGTGAPSAIANAGDITVTAGAGTFTIGSGVAFHNSGSITLQTGALLIAQPDFSDFTGYLALRAGSKLLLGPNAPGMATPYAFSIAGSSSSGWTASLDLANNALGFEASSASDKLARRATLLSQINAAKNGGTWTGNGITSATVRANPSVVTLGLFDNADLALSTFRGIPVDTLSLIVVAALQGDANLDNTVDLADYDLWYTHVGSPGNATSRGDFNLDNAIDLADYDAWYQHVGAAFPLSSYGIPNSPTPIPEPATFAWPLTLLLLYRTRRRPSR